LSEIGCGGHGVGELDLVFLHDSGNGRFDQRRAEARENWSDAAENLLVEDGALGEVGDLGGATDVGGSGQDGVLKDRAQDGVGADTLGGACEDVEKARCAEDVRASAPLGLSGGGIADAAKSDALAGLGVEQEEERGGLSDEDLGVVPVRDELCGAVEERLMEVVSVFDSAAQGTSTYRVELTRGGIDDDEALPGEDVCDETTKGGGERRRSAA
jgi:hypothetical protein